ncbi:MAG: YfaZ family protein [Gallionella sp.]|nr:YfaZ family protein [Gallionella sp.]
MSLRRIVPASLFAIGIMATCSTSALADTVDINLRDTSAQFQYISSLGRDPLGKTKFHVGVLYHNRNNMLGDFGLVVQDELGDNAPGFSVGVGIKGLVAKVAGDTRIVSRTSAMALGGLVRYSPPEAQRFGVVGEIYMSPNIVTFGDANRYVQSNVRAEYEVIPQAVAYLGYRRIEFGINNRPNEILDEGVFLGVRISF